jgi:hypothetical protein
MTGVKLRFGKVVISETTALGIVLIGTIPIITTPTTEAVITITDMTTMGTLLSSNRAIVMV